MTMKKSTSLLALLVVLLLGPLACSGPSDSGASSDATQASGHHPVIVLLVDGVRADSPGASPVLRAFVEGAVRFEQAFTQAPDADAALASLLTALYPTSHGLVDAGDSLVADAETLPEILSQAGLATAAFLDGEEFSGLGLEQGFERFETGPAALESAAAWLGSDAPDEFFALIHAGSVQVSSIDPEAAAEAYAAQLAALEEAVAGLLSTIETAGLSDKATIAIVSLTGFDLGEHGAVGVPNIWAPVTRIPMVLKSPAISEPVSIDKIVEVLDLAPTVLELLGEKPVAAMQGQSLLALINGAGTPPYVAFGESPEAGGRQFAALGGYRLIQHQADGVNELYNFTADLAETSDLAASEENRVTVLDDHLSAWKKMVSVASLDPERRTEELDDEALEQLRSLGYIQ